MKCNNYLLLVNKTNAIENDNIFDLIEYTNSLDEKYLVENRTLKAFIELKNYMSSIGIEIDMDSAHRTIEYQSELMNRFIMDKGEEYAKEYVAPPGCSEHHTGLAIDIIILRDGIPIDDSETFYNEEMNIVHENLYRYGFILRYLSNKECITGYSYEPWHIRYIDSPNIAKYIYDNDLCLEEYLENK